MENSEISLQTLSQTTEGIYTEKGSKFIGIAFPITNEEDFKNKLKETQGEYKGARHYCFAYTIKSATEIIQRSHDAGEPTGTAGRPILNQITKLSLVNVAVIVVRYFGGILLGTAGLVKAYGEAARLAIEKNSIVTIEKKYLIKIQSDYTNYQKLIDIIKKQKVLVEEYFYEDYVLLKSVIPVKIYDKIEKELLILKSKSNKIEFSILNHFFK